MFGKTETSALIGIDGRRVVVEADFSDGLPSFEMVGFLGSEVKEAKERVRSAIKNSGIVVPPGRLTVNLSPADLRKQGNSFDLPIAVAVLVALGVIPQEYADGISFIGELSLDGRLRSTRGILSHVMFARSSGRKTCIVPLENGAEAAVFDDFSVLCAGSLQEVMEILLDRSQQEKHVAKRTEEDQACEHTPDFSEVKGQESVKRAVLIASAGMHGLLMVGPPGTGKTLSARRIPSILPPLSREEQIECTKIHSIAGLLAPEAGLLKSRPFRSPHHSVSQNAIVGGGSTPKPGEMSLAHNGVLFLDELSEYRRSTIEAMRMPLEDKKVVISRVSGSYLFPTRVMLVAAMNPCRCGYYPDRTKCKCTDQDVRNYLQRISKPMLDRIDIITEVPRVSIEKLSEYPVGQTSADMRDAVIRAWEIEKERYQNTGIIFNSELEGSMIRKYCALGTDQKDLLKEAFEKLNLSARTYDRILKVARTIADVDQSAEISIGHLAEAISYRSMDQKFWGDL